MSWTPDRPTKPGKYELSLHPDARAGLPVQMTAEVAPMPDWLRCDETDAGLIVRGDVDAGTWLIELSSSRLDRALWRPYVDPADPHAQPVPQPDGTALPPDELDDLETIITSGKGQAEVPRDVATSVGDYCAQCAYDCMELPVLVKDGHWQCQRRAHWYPVRVRVWLDAIRECRQERGDRAERETLAPQPVPSLRSRVEALPWYAGCPSGGPHLDRSEVLALLESEGM